MSVLRAFVFLLVGGVSLLPSPAWSMACRVTTTPLSFGTYDLFLATAKTATAQVTVSCNNKPVAPVPIQLTLSPGSSGNFGGRSMTGSSGGSPLVYNIYSNAGMSTVMGDGSGGSTALNTLLDKTADWIVILYASIPPRQTVLVGTYTDSLIATIIY